MLETHIPVLIKVVTLDYNKGLVQRKLKTVALKFRR